ncbi:type II secretion system protein [Thermodesulfobacteriota bacterium]
MTSPREIDYKGFTLIEIIATLLVVSILGTLLFQYFGESFMRSSKPIERLNQTLILQQVIENINEDYERSPKTETYIDSILRINIGNAGTDQDNPYGKYSVVENHFIKFVGELENPITAADPKDTLKVTLKNKIDESMTIFFTLQ